MEKEILYVLVHVHSWPVLAFAAMANVTATIGSSIFAPLAPTLLNKIATYNCEMAFGPRDY